MCPDKLLHSFEFIMTTASVAKPPNSKAKMRQLKDLTKL